MTDTSSPASASWSGTGALLRFTTAGSVDDGKSTLIGRLLHDSKGIFEDQLDHVRDTSARRGQDGVDLSLITDGLRAEREQGITIDVAYRYFSSPRRAFIIADTPGHEQYTRNMVTGASTADAAVVLIDARHGLVIQSRRHAAIAHLLGIEHIGFAINKMDLVQWSEERFREIERTVRAWAEPLTGRTFTFLPMSAKLGDGVVDPSARMPWYGGPTLLQWLESLPVAARAMDRPLRLPIQWVSRPQSADLHDFRGYMGRIESGTLRVGQEVLIAPSGRTTVVERIHRWGGDLQEAAAPMSVCVTLRDDVDAGRGDVLADPATPPRVQQDHRARLSWMAEKPLQIGGRYLLKQGTKTVRAVVRALDHRLDVEQLTEDPNADSLKMNDIGTVVIRTQQPLAVDDYAIDRTMGSFILIDEFSNGTVAAGIVGG